MTVIARQPVENTCGLRPLDAGAILLGGGLNSLVATVPYLCFASIIVRFSSSKLSCDLAKEKCTLYNQVRERRPTPSSS